MGFTAIGNIVASGGRSKTGSGQGRPDTGRARARPLGLISKGALYLVVGRWRSCSSSATGPRGSQRSAGTDRLRRLLLRRSEVPRGLTVLPEPDTKLEQDDAEGDPGQRDAVSADDVAQIVDAEVDPAEADQEHEGDGGAQRDQLGPPRA